MRLPMHRDNAKKCDRPKRPPVKRRVLNRKLRGTDDGKMKRYKEKIASDARKSEIVN